MWRGALTPRQERGVVSIRKQPLASFMHTSRLRTLVVHINESGKSYMRRPYEMTEPTDYYEDFASEEINEDELEIFGMEVRRTDLQPNYRKTRSMRTVQGMDFIYQLRDMRYVRFYDSNAEHARRPIRDWSFLQDVNNMVRRKKDDSMALKSELENLLYLKGLHDFTPDDQLHELVKSFYDETPVEDVSVGGSETSEDSSGISGFSTFSGDSGPDDDSADSSHTAPGSSRGSPDHDMSEVVVILDSDDEMEDDDGSSDGSGSDGSQPSYVALSETVSDSRRSLRSGSSRSDDHPYDTGQNTTITPQPRVITIKDDEDDDRKRGHRRPGGGFSTDSSSLFMPSGSCTAGSVDNSLSSDNERPTGVIDLTLEDDDEEPRGPADPDSSETEGPVAGQSRKRSGSNDGPG